MFPCKSSARGPLQDKEVIPSNSTHFLDQSQNAKCGTMAPRSSRLMQFAHPSLPVALLRVCLCFCLCLCVCLGLHLCLTTCLTRSAHVALRLGNCWYVRIVPALTCPVRRLTSGDTQTSRRLGMTASEPSGVDTAAHLGVWCRCAWEDSFARSTTGAGRPLHEAGLPWAQSLRVRLL